MNQSDFEKLAKQIKVPEKHLRYILEQLKLYIPKAEVWAFGSRIKDSNRTSSDLDLAILCDEDTAKKQLLKLNEVLIESDIPFKVQLLDFKHLPKNMQDNIKKQYIIIYQPVEKKE